MMVSFRAAAPLVWALACAAKDPTTTEPWCPEGMRDFHIENRCNSSEFPTVALRAESDVWTMFAYWNKFCENRSDWSVLFRYYVHDVFNPCSSDADCPQHRDTGCATSCKPCHDTEENGEECRGPNTCQPPKYDDCYRLGENGWMNPENATSWCPDAARRGDESGEPQEPREPEEPEEPESRNPCYEQMYNESVRYCNVFNAPDLTPQEMKEGAVQCYRGFAIEYHRCNARMFKDGAITEAEFQNNKGWAYIPYFMANASEPLWCPEELYEFKVEDDCSSKEGVVRVIGESDEWHFHGRWHEICEFPEAQMLKIHYHKRDLRKPCSTDADCSHIKCDTYCKACEVAGPGASCEHAATCEPRAEGDCEKFVEMWVSPDAVGKQCEVSPESPEPRDICLEPVGRAWEETGCDVFFQENNATQIPDAKQKAAACLGHLEWYDDCMKKNFEASDPDYYNEHKPPREYYEPLERFLGPTRKCVNIPAFQAEEMKVLPCQ